MNTVGIELLNSPTNWLTDDLPRSSSYKMADFQPSNKVSHYRCASRLVSRSGRFYVLYFTAEVILRRDLVPKARRHLERSTRMVVKSTR